MEYQAKNDSLNGLRFWMIALEIEDFVNSELAYRELSEIDET